MLQSDNNVHFRGAEMTTNHFPKGLRLDDDVVRARRANHQAKRQANAEFAKRLAESSEKSFAKRAFTLG